MWETLLVLRELDLKRHTGAVGAVELLRAFGEDKVGDTFSHVT